MAGGTATLERRAGAERRRGRDRDAGADRGADGAWLTTPGERARVAVLAEAARRGDPEAFEALVVRFQGPITAYCRALTGDRDLAEDAAQEAFLLVHRRLPRLRSPHAFRAWIYRIAEHAALTCRRRRGRRAREVLFPGMDPPGDAAAPAFAGEAAPAGAASLVREALGRIPEAYAGVLALHYVQELSCREIADTLGITPNNARQRLYRARHALRRDPACRGLGAGTGRGPADAP